jgi:hypothetical protein
VLRLKDRQSARRLSDHRQISDIFRYTIAARDSLFHFLINRFAVQPQDARGLGLVPAASFQHVVDVAPFDLFQGYELARIKAADKNGVAGKVADLFREVLDRDLVMASQRDGSSMPMTWMR